MCEEDRETDHEHGEGAAPEADSQALNDVGGGAGFRGFRNIPDRPHRRVVLGDKADCDAGHRAGQDGPENGLAHPDRANRGVAAREEEQGGEPGGIAESGCRPHALENLDREDAEQRRDRAHCRQHERQRHQPGADRLGGVARG